MSISTESELKGMQLISEVVATTLSKMRNQAKIGMSTKELDDYGCHLLYEYGARPAPSLTYGFPGCTCISVNHEIAHGIPSNQRVLREGDLVNIDVSAELNGFWSDNGGSFVLGNDINNYQPLVEASKEILKGALANISGGVRIADVGGYIEQQAKKRGLKVIRNLTGHGVGRSLHESPREVANFRDKYNHERFKKNSVVAVETFISTKSTLAKTGLDGWTLTGNRGGFVAQHEHTIIVTDNEPVILTAMNGIF